jgi:hypothetical protein
MRGMAVFYNLELNTPMHRCMHHRLRQPLSRLLSRVGCQYIMPFVMAATVNLLHIAAQVTLILTLFVVAWYTWETHLLRRLQIRPALIVTVDLDNNALFVRNLGSSAALNIEIPDFQGAAQIISANPGWFDFLQANEHREIGLRSPIAKWQGLVFETVLADGPLLIFLRYQDIDGISYETETEVSLKRTRIVYTRRVSLWPKWAWLRFCKKANG